MKKYVVNIDMVWSKDIVVSARTIADAKRKGWEMFKKKLSDKPSKNNFTLTVIINKT
jgi:hypothetical protein